MHARRYAIIGLLIASPVTALAAGKMAPAEIKATFGTGVPFAATSSGGQSYTFTFMPDGTATQVAKGAATPTTGTWRVNTTGYCSKWAGGSEHCYTVERNADKFDVRDVNGRAISRWSLLP